MANVAQDVFQFIRTKITIEDNNELINFFDLVIKEALADVNNFSFIWRQQGGEPSLQAHIDFYKKYLSKNVTISVQDSYSFKGMIDSISCVRHDELGVEYEIKGTGLFGKLNEVAECNSFYKKNLSKIFDAVNTGQGTKIKSSPKNKSDLFYTVQYNQTAFEFYKMLAVRNGEWLFYNGTELVLGEPDSSSVEELKIDVDVQDIFINATARKASSKTAGYDEFKGENLKHTYKSSTSGNGLINAATKAGDNAFGDSQSASHFPNAATSPVLESMNKLRHKAMAASSVYISATSQNPKIKIGGKIKLTSRSDKNEGEYIVTAIQHHCISDNNYKNSFYAIPADAEVPPYTDPFVFPVCRSQPAVVVKNEDKDGLDRIKVRFPWQQDADNTPWITVLTPHAGKDKGIRFLPEVDEEVLIGFINNNAEQPFVIGAVHTEKNKSGDAHEGNHNKIIGTKTGRRLEIDDDKGVMKFYDNYTDKTPKNGILFKRSDGNTQSLIESQKDANNYSVIVLDNEESLKMGVVNGGSLVVEIKMEKDGKKITIHSTGSIELNADQSISLNAANIEIKASQELKMEGAGKGAELKGLKVAVSADTNLEMKGLQTTVDGTAKLDLSSAALVGIAAALVKIN